MDRNISYARHCIGEDDIAAVARVLRGDFITQGPIIAEFEGALADACGARHCVVLNSGTSALHAAYFALGLKAGDEFILPPVTFAATGNAGLYLGARPVFVDIEPETGNLDSALLERAITPRTRLIVPVHYAGRPVRLDEVRAVARKCGLAVIEDACHALGAFYKNERIGSCSHSEMAVLSFHPAKHITTGEGGAVLTNDESYYRRLLAFRTHGITREGLVDPSPGAWYYEMQHLGYNYRLTDLQAALGLSQLAKLPRFVARRREIAAFYDRALADHPHLDIIRDPGDVRSSYHLYPILVKDKAKRPTVFKTLRELGLGVQVHYIPVYRHPYYRSLGYRAGLCPAGEDFYAREISIPLYPAMSDDDAAYVVECLSRAFI